MSKKSMLVEVNDIIKMDLSQVGNVLNNKVKDAELEADILNHFVSIYPEAGQLEGKEFKSIEEWEGALQAIGLDADEVKKSLRIYFLKKHGSDMFREMGFDEAIFELAVNDDGFVDVLANIMQETEKKIRKAFSRVFEEGECVICYDNFESGLKCVRCKNIFHQGCLEVVLCKYKKCPVCRASF